MEEFKPEYIDLEAKDNEPLFTTLEPLNLKNIEKELATIHKDYKKALEKKTLLKDELRQLELFKTNVELMAKAEASMAKTEDGKKLFNNDTEREAEVLRKTSNNAEYNQALSVLNEKTKQLSSLDNELIVMDLQCRNFRSIIDSQPREMRMITWPGG